MKINANEVVAKIKELHGVNCAPYSKSLQNNQQYVDEVFGYIGTPRSRLHDCCGAYGGCYFVDVPNIFRNFDADENDPENYDFHYTDEYIGSIIKTGAQIVYRLGVTIEWGSKKYSCHPPKDFNKWARICEHIIMHYNKGWKNGFEWNIEYWEIWNEPENPPMWTGTMEQFFELYRVASIYLKEKFPEIKIGGYGSCGFYAAFRPNMSDFHKSFLTWYEEFLKFVKENGCPLDFYSWHIYTPDVNEILLSAKHVKDGLLKYGFDKTESHLNEWNYGAEGGGFDNMDTMIGAGFIADALIGMQKQSSVDLAQYYCLSINGGYNGMMNLRTHVYTPVMHVYWAFNKLFRAGSEIKSERSYREPQVLAAKDENGKIYMLLSNYKKFTGCAAELDFTGAKNKTAKVYKLSDCDGFVPVGEVCTDKPSRFYFDKNALYYIEA